MCKKTDSIECGLCEQDVIDEERGGICMNCFNASGEGLRGQLAEGNLMVEHFGYGFSAIESYLRLLRDNMEERCERARRFKQPAPDCARYRTAVITAHEIAKGGLECLAAHKKREVSPEIILTDALHRAQAEAVLAARLNPKRLLASIQVLEMRVRALEAHLNNAETC